jgi:DNA-binding LytR/AlgR family response regulator
MRVLVIDDEALARENLIRMLSCVPGVEIAGEAGNGLEALERISECSPEAIFIDIEMPGLSGFEVIESLNRPLPVVFVTAYDEYAIRAFEANAVDYLLKPVQPERVAKCLTKLESALRRETSAQPEHLRKLLAELRPSGPRRIAVRKGDRYLLLSPREVVHISASDKSVYVHTARETYNIDKTVTEMEELLSRSGFYRISRSALVNLEAVREMMPWFSGAWRVRMTTGTELDVSRDRVRDLKRVLQM